ncbi:hypothetical protein JW921_07945 [Candidatus Fermentibacterales bacterium]|nr:hypothetical protein [Candidatus Fermentibacterales bacterium]
MGGRQIRTESLECPNCGASIPAPDGQGVVVCRYCHSTIRLSAEGGGSAPAIVDASALPDEVRDLIRGHIAAGRTMQAISAYREQTSLPLKQSKEAVENMAREMGIELPKPSSLPCVLIPLGFLVWVGLIALMPFVAPWVARQVLGEGVSAGTVETSRALLPIIFVVVSVAVFFVALGRSRKGR